MLAPNVPGQNQKQGVMIEGAFRRSAKDCFYLHLKFSNQSTENLSGFMLKINNNLFGINCEE